MERSSLDQQLSEDVAMLRDTVRSFAGERVAPRHEAVDHVGEHPTEIVAGLAELGLFGILASADLGGVGMGALAHVVAVEELARAGGFAGAILCAHGIAVDALGGAPFAAEMVPGLLGGDAFAAPAIAPGIRASGDRLTGEHAVVAFPGRAAVYVIAAADAAGRPAAFAVDAGARGVSHVPTEPLGLLGFETGTLVLEDAPARTIGGAAAAARMIASARMQVGALLLGIGAGAIAHAVRYAHERKQFDKLLAEFLAIQERVARGAARVEAAQALVHGAARLKDAGEPHAVAAARARFVARESAVGAADDGLQVFGGYGYSREYPAERFYRDANFCGFGEADSAALIGEIAGDLG